MSSIAVTPSADSAAITMVAPSSLQHHFAARRTGGDGERAGLDAIGDHRVAHGTELAGALDLDRRRPHAVDPPTHLLKEVGEVRQLGLPRGVLDHRGSSGC